MYASESEGVRVRERKRRESARDSERERKRPGIREIRQTDREIPGQTKVSYLFVPDWTSLVLTPSVEILVPYFTGLILCRQLYEILLAGLLKGQGIQTNSIFSDFPRFRPGVLAKLPHLFWAILNQQRH